MFPVFLPVLSAMVFHSSRLAFTFFTFMNNPFCVARRKHCFYLQYDILDA